MEKDTDSFSIATWWVFFIFFFISVIFCSITAKTLAEKGVSRISRKQYFLLTTSHQYSKTQCAHNLCMMCLKGHQQRQRGECRLWVSVGCHSIFDVSNFSHPNLSTACLTAYISCKWKKNTHTSVFTAGASGYFKVCSVAFLQRDFS